MCRRIMIATVCAAGLALIWGGGVRIFAQSPQNSEQVVFSGVAFAASTFPNNTPAGFWIWCESDSSNPYLGECQGAMYFYALGLTEHVAGEITEVGGGLYSMDVSSRDGSIACTLKNAAPPVRGPRNTVDVSCATPSGSAISPNAVVNVTGP